MKLPDQFWTYAKVAFIAYAFFGTLTAGPEYISSSPDAPLWLPLIVLVFFGLFLPRYLKSFESTVRYLRRSPWPAFPFSIMRDPYPFWHLGYWIAFASAVPATYYAIMPFDRGKIIEPLFYWAAGFGALFATFRTRKALE